MSTGNRLPLKLQSWKSNSFLRLHSTVQDTHLWDKSDTPPIYFREGKVDDTKVNREPNHRTLPQGSTAYAQRSQPPIEISGSQRLSRDTTPGGTRSSSAQEQLRETIRNMVRSHKRKAEAPLEGRSKLRRRGNAADKAKKYSEPSSATNNLNGKNQDIQGQQHNFHILPTIKTLTEHDLPEIPKKLFSTPKSTLHDVLQRTKGKITATFTQNKNRGIITCTLTCKLPSIEPLSVSGQHNTKVSPPVVELDLDNKSV